LAPELTFVLGGDQTITLSADGGGRSAAVAHADPLVAAEACVRDLTDAVVRDQARAVVDRLRVALATYDVVGIPPLVAGVDADGSCVIEWSVHG
jgi:hypothetical protein